MTPEPGPVEVSWGRLSLAPEGRAAVAIRATDDPQIVLLEMQRFGEPMLKWFLHRSSLRSIAHQFSLWSSEYGRGPD